MTISLANQKKAKLLELQRTYLNTLTFRLFTNNHTPADTDTESAYSGNEPSDSGYAAVTNAGFTTAVLSGGKGVTTAPNMTFGPFVHSGSDYTIYGYWVTDPADSDKLVWAERAAAPFTVTAAGQTYTVAPPTMTLTTQ